MASGKEKGDHWWVAGSGNKGSSRRGEGGVLRLRADVGRRHLPPHCTAEANTSPVRGGLAHMGLLSPSMAFSTAIVVWGAGRGGSDEDHVEVVHHRRSSRLVSPSKASSVATVTWREGRGCGGGKATAEEETR
uniref:DUF834 domain-containing protein n=1 Tax=Oryza punctata TaxID=4537 RepID=A0A0E0JX51_ORYPU